MFFSEPVENGGKMKENRKKTKKKALIGISVLVALIALLGIFYAVFSAKPVTGSKKITIEVVNKAQESMVYEVKTDAEFLRQAMEETDGLDFSGEEGPYGIMIQSINGETADYNVDQSYWSFEVNGEYCNYGVDEQPVMDGDAFSIIYTID